MPESVEPDTTRSPGYQPSMTRRLVMMGLCIAGLIGVWSYYFYVTSHPAEEASSAAVTLVVVPFSSDPGYLGAGQASEVARTLNGASGLRVIVVDQQDPPEAAKRFHATGLLKGSVTTVDGRLQIAAQLLHPATGKVLWAQSFNQNEAMAAAVANTLQVKLQTAASPRAPSSAAYDWYLRGRSEFLTNSATADFEKAIAADPLFAAAYAALAENAVILGYYHPTPDAWPQAKAAAAKTLELDSTSAEAHAALGLLNAVADWNWASSDQEFRRALELAPGSGEIHSAYAVAYLAPTGHQDSALTESKLGRDFDPLSFFTNDSAARVLMLGHQYEQAAEQYRKFPDFKSPLADVRQERGIATALGAKPDSSSGQPSIEELALRGRLDEALLRLKSPGKEGLRNIQLARCFAIIGDKDTAFSYLNKALEDHDSQVIWLKVDPRFDSLRSDPRCTALLKQINL